MAWNRSASFRLSQWLKIIRYRRVCINEPVILSHCVHLKLGHRFHALLKVYFDRDNTVPLWVCNTELAVAASDSFCILKITSHSRFPIGPCVLSVNGIGFLRWRICKLIGGTKSCILCQLPTPSASWQRQQSIWLGRYNIRNVDKSAF